MALHMVLCLVLNSNLQHTTYIIKNRPFGRFFIKWIATPLSVMTRNDKEGGAGWRIRFLQSAEFKVQSANDVSHTRQVLFTGLPRHL